MVSTYRSRRVCLATFLWLAACLSASALLWRYESTPGASGRPPGSWPADTVLARTPGRAALLLFTHPRCACSIASLAELARLATAQAGRIDVAVVVSAAAGDGVLVDKARAVPGARLVFDGGAEARRFGVETSGHALLYGGDGRLLFSGGITDARGHEGRGVGRDRIEHLLRGIRDRANSPVFGCGLSPGPTGGDAI